MNALKKHKVGTLKDAYDALLDGCIICNPKHSPWQDPKYKYCKMHLDTSDNSIFAYGIGRADALPRKDGFGYRKATGMVELYDRCK